LLAIIIQARLGSSRLPGKIIKKIYKDKTVLDILLKKLKILKTKIIIATTTNNSDRIIVETAKKHNLDYFCGDEQNVLKRFIDCAIKYNISDIIRITSDNIFIQPSLITPLINQNLNKDYISYKVDNRNVVLTHWGFFAEFVTLKALKKVLKLSDDKRDREHVTYYIYNHPEEFDIEFWDVPKDLNRNDIRLTIDTIEDFKICQKIVNYLKEKDLEWHYKNILEYINNNPKILERMKLNINKVEKRI